MSDDGLGLDAGGTGATAYAEALAVYLAFCLDKATLDRTRLKPLGRRTQNRLTQAFGRQAIPMIWTMLKRTRFPTQVAVRDHCPCGRKGGSNGSRQQIYRDSGSRRCRQHD